MESGEGLEITGTEECRVEAITMKTNELVADEPVSRILRGGIARTQVTDSFHRQNVKDVNFGRVGRIHCTFFFARPLDASSPIIPKRERVLFQGGREN